MIPSSRDPRLPKDCFNVLMVGGIQSACIITSIALFCKLRCKRCVLVLYFGFTPLHGVHQQLTTDVQAQQCRNAIATVATISEILFFWTCQLVIQIFTLASAIPHTSPQTNHEELAAALGKLLLMHSQRVQVPKPAKGVLSRHPSQGSNDHDGNKNKRNVQLIIQPSVTNQCMS